MYYLVLYAGKKREWLSSCVVFVYRGREKKMEKKNLVVARNSKRLDTVFCDTLKNYMVDIYNKGLRFVLKVLRKILDPFQVHFGMYQIQ